MFRKGLIVSSALLLSACSMSPQPYSVQDRYHIAQRDLKQLFSKDQEVKRNLDFYQALARGLKYNLDYRIKLANNALQMGQLHLAEFAMLPALNETGSLYTRNNDLASFGITSTGAPTDVLTSTPRTLRSTRGAVSWNILDFGVSYVKAKQQTDTYLIAREEARKQLQQLAQDILTAYWDAYSAQELMLKTRTFQAKLSKAKHNLEVAMLDNLVPKENLLRYQEALLTGNRHLIQLQAKYDKAMFDLKHLLRIPLNLPLHLLKPPLQFDGREDLSKIDFKKLDSLSLVLRPELRGQSYQKRIADWGVKTAILQAIPGMTFTYGWNYNSNKYLVNRLWVDKSVDVAWNLLNLASLPTSLNSARAQIKYEKLKRMALTLAVLTETRYAFSHYQNLLNEYRVAKLQTDNANAQFILNRNRQRAALASEQQVILAEIHALSAKMEEDLLLSDLSTAMGELYLSVGFDMLPLGISNKPLPEVVSIVRRNMIARNQMDFKAYVDYTYHRIFSKKPQ